MGHLRGARSPGQNDTVWHKAAESKVDTVRSILCVCGWKEIKNYEAPNAINPSHVHLCLPPGLTRISRTKTDTGMTAMLPVLILT